MNKLKSVGSLFFVGVLALVLILPGCTFTTKDGKKVTWPASSGSSTKSQTIQSGSRSSGTAIENSEDPSCEGIVVTGAGEEMFRGLVPVKYVDLKNTSSKRKKVLLDIKYGIKGRSLNNVYSEEVWEQYGPITTPPNEEGRVFVKKGDPSYEKRKILLIRVAECS